MLDDPGRRRDEPVQHTPDLGTTKTTAIFEFELQLNAGPAEPVLPQCRASKRGRFDQVVRSISGLRRETCDTPTTQDDRSRNKEQDARSASFFAFRCACRLLRETKHSSSFKAPLLRSGLAAPLMKWERCPTTLSSAAMRRSIAGSDASWSPRRLPPRQSPCALSHFWCLLLRITLNPSRLCSRRRSPWRTCPLLRPSPAWG